MTHSDPNRLDRIEALVEKIGQRVDSNARAIEALSESNAEVKKEQKRLYQIMGDLGQSHANLAQAQSRIYQVIDNLDERQGQLSRRQGEIVNILKLLVNKDSTN